MGLRAIDHLERGTALSVRFDLRAFHDAILSEGHLPLSMLRERMDGWIEDTAGKAAPSGVR
ncbi:MAG: DUF885 family protein [Betaproteobacteria bacterium]|nr:DUF885 family protein [Betaproteobacteria bacterium]